MKVVGETQDREVAAESAVGGQQRRVDRSADGDVDRVDGHVLQVVKRAWALDVELVERGQVDHADVVAHVEVFGIGDR